MSRPQDGTEMDRPTTGGSIRRARERAQAGLPREDFSTFVQRQASDQPPIAQPAMLRRPGIPPSPAPARARNPRPPAPPGLQTKDGQIGVAISRPTPMPQWPLAGPLASPASSAGTEPYRPPPGRSQPPQRPPRPSVVPSILDGSRVQDPTPSFQYAPQDARDAEGSTPAAPETPSSAVSRPSTLSSVGSIPDFPLPLQASSPVSNTARRSANLGPPPSARRGASSFYSNASFVSPIPEESPRSRSHASFASSTAIPESWGTQSPGPSPNYPESGFDEAIIEEDVQQAYDEEGDESSLVRSASVGKRSKASLVTTPSRGLDVGATSQRPSPSPVQPDPFNDGTGYLDASSSSSNTVPTVKAPAVALTADSILSAYDAASSTDPSNPSRRMSVSPQPPDGARSYSRLSAVRRPPKLDMDAVRKAEARGSLTSLPDLIRRATRLAASLERGKRPASRFDLNDFPPDIYGGGGGEKELSSDYEKHQSGLSDMLAAFPPPAQATNNNNRRSFRQTLRGQVNSWPLPANFNGSQYSLPESREGSGRNGRTNGRRCCGLPLWAFIVLVVVLVVVIAAAVVVPVEFLVIRKKNAGSGARPATQQCQGRLTCANGGTTVVNDGVCSCICTDGFTGFDCSVAGADGCTTTDISSDASSITNVTLGDALPRLVQQAQANFSIPLSSTQILGKFNAGNLSCAAENALVTFDGQSVRQGAANGFVVDNSSETDAAVVNKAVQVVNDVAVVTVIVVPGATITRTIDAAAATGANGVRLGAAAGLDLDSVSTILATTLTISVSFAPQETSDLATTTTTVTTTITTRVRSTPTTSTSTSTPTDTTTAPSATFMATEEVLDFARVAVLYILQQESLGTAEQAQVALQRFFTSASNGILGQGGGVSIDSAKNLTLGNGNSVDLVHLLVDVGGGVIGKNTAATKLRLRELATTFL